MSEFDKLKDDAEQYAKDHPEQVHEASRTRASRTRISGTKASNRRTAAGNARKGVSGGGTYPGRGRCGL